MIRKINEADLKTIYNLGSKYDSNFNKTYNLELYLKNPIYLLYCFEENKTIKGFIIATIMNNDVEILLIFVDNIYRGQNIGFMLLDYVEKLGNTCVLEVSIENTAAYHLYLKKDYQEINRRKGYYNGVDAIVMKKVLKWKMYIY